MRRAAHDQTAFSALGARFLSSRRARMPPSAIALPQAATAPPPPPAAAAYAASPSAQRRRLRIYLAPRASRAAARRDAWACVHRVLSSTLSRVTRVTTSRGARRLVGNSNIGGSRLYSALFQIAANSSLFSPPHQDTLAKLFAARGGARGRGRPTAIDGARLSRHDRRHAPRPPRPPLARDARAAPVEISKYGRAPQKAASSIEVVQRARKAFALYLFRALHISNRRTHLSFRIAANSSSNRLNRHNYLSLAPAGRVLYIYSTRYR